MDTETNPYESIGGGLDTAVIGRRVIYYPRVASTMGAARREARRGAAGGTVIIAGEQTGGWGRVKRKWLTPPGNIAFSVILYPDVSSLPYLVMLASLAVVRGIEAVTGLEAQIKWPNDVLMGGKKVCGILTESDVRGEGVAYAIIGVGINVGLRASDYPEISGTASGLNAEAAKSVPLADIVRHVLVEMDRLYLDLPGGEAVYEEWRRRLVTLGEKVYVSSGGGRLEGVAEAVDRSGALLLRQDDGSLTKVIAGDVKLRDE